jgi:hypothetical protein
MSNQSDLPLPGLEPTLPSGVMPSQLPKAEADRLAAMRVRLIERQADTPTEADASNRAKLIGKQA